MYLTVVGKLFFYILYCSKQIFLKENQIKTYALEIAFYQWRIFVGNAFVGIASVICLVFEVGQ